MNTPTPIRPAPTTSLRAMRVWLRSLPPEKIVHEGVCGCIFETFIQSQGYIFAGVGCISFSYALDYSWPTTLRGRLSRTQRVVRAAVDDYSNHAYHTRTDGRLTAEQAIDLLDRLGIRP